uniref:KIND domain-containing protein n=1 Tax=Mastacembelus armatus TaxID=205130 RepID=A0A7N8WQ84_9TELE
MGTFVTLAEVLEARGSPLDEDEVWFQANLIKSFQLASVTSFWSGLCLGSGTMCSVLSPGSVLLSASGNLAFKSCVRYEDMASFMAPEVQQGHTASTRTVMVVYSLGMTLYWCVDYHLPQNQPVNLSGQLEGLLLSMCEDMVVRRTDLLTVVETCERHHKVAMLPPAEHLIRQLVEDVYRNSGDHVPMAENGSQLTDRSQMVRNRLHSKKSCLACRHQSGVKLTTINCLSTMPICFSGGSLSNSAWALKKKISRSFSGASYPSDLTGYEVCV